MRARITNDGGRAGASTKLTSFAALDEENDVLEAQRRKEESLKAEAAKRARQEEKVRKQMESMKGMSWADIDDDDEEEEEEDKHAQAAGSESDDESESIHVVMNVKPKAKATGKKKKVVADDDLDEFLAKMGDTMPAAEAKKGGKPIAAESVEDANREAARAQLKAKLAAQQRSRKAGATKEEAAAEGTEAGDKKKKSKKEKKEARKMYER